MLGNAAWHFSWKREHIEEEQDPSVSLPRRLIHRCPGASMLVFFVGFVAAATHMVTGEYDSTKPDSPRIVGGYEIDLAHAPFLVSMQQQGMHYCGGAILTLSHIITGCHCLGEADLGMSHKDIKTKHKDGLTVVAGTENLVRPTKDVQRRAVSEIMLHPNCSYESILVYDFALAFLGEPLTETARVRPFTLVSPEKDTYDQLTRQLVGNKERHCYVAGWGSTQIDPDGGNHQANPRLKAARMFVIPDADCEDKLGTMNDKFAYFNFSANAQMCTLSYGSRKNESDCRGDSGGPFFCGSKVYGVVSYGYKCGQWDMPNVYARISFAIDWLQELHLIKLVPATDREELPEIRNVRKTSQAAPTRDLKKSVFFLMATLCLLITSTLR